MYKILIFISYCVNFGLSYKPVILLHGILTGSHTMEIIKNRIEEVYV